MRSIQTLKRFGAIIVAICCIGLSIAQGGQTTGTPPGNPPSGTTTTTAGTESKPPKELQNKATNPEAAPAGIGTMMRTGNEMYLTIACLTFGIIVMLIIRFSLPKNWEQVDITRVYGTPLLITATIVLVAAGISQEAVAPAYGLFGTIAGFVLSKNLNENRQGGDASKAEASSKPKGSSDGNGDPQEDKDKDKDDKKGG